MSAHRIEQIESTLKRELATVLARDMADPRICGMISITDIDVSPDLRQATVKVSVMPDKYESRSVHGLNHATRHIHAKLSKRVALRMVPHLEFKLDRTLKKQAEVEAAIRAGMARETDTPTANPDIDNTPGVPGHTGMDADHQAPNLTPKHEQTSSPNPSGESL